MSNYESQLESEIEQLRQKLEQAERERDTFQELLDNVIMETFKRYNNTMKEDTEIYSAMSISPQITEAVSKKYVADTFGIDVDKEYDRIFKERTERTIKEKK